ncbi:MAG: penicillin-binding protein [Eubacterium sp.]|nr:penicillin-binding protein [Eubacterium sp.]
MRRLERRAIICMTLAAVLLAGLFLFVVRYVSYGAEWATFYGNQAVYNGGVLASGAIYDVNGVLLSENGGGSINYNDDEGIRIATMHTVGDVKGNVATSAQNVFRDKLIGYNLVTGTYKMSGKNEDITLTLDAEVCKTAYEGLSQYKAGCVGIYNYKTGEILCKVSWPSFDPVLVEPDLAEDDTSGVYIDRFLSGTFVPGSIFKTVTSAAVIETTSDYDSFVYECSGTREVNGEDLNCAYAHGTVDFPGALASSCNGAFSVLTERVGAANMKAYVDKLGLTTRYDIDGVTNAAGSFEFPSDVALNLDWAGIGQYHDMVNPCSMMVYMGAIASGGKAAVPKLLHTAISLPDTTDRMIEDATAKKLQEMMKQDVVESYGESNFPGLDIYAKTGTAEVAGHDPTAWFAGFLKDKDHPYAFVVCIEDAGEALYTAAPLANSVLQAAVNG